MKYFVLFSFTFNLSIFVLTGLIIAGVMSAILGCLLLLLVLEIGWENM